LFLTIICLVILLLFFTLLPLGVHVCLKIEDTKIDFGMKLNLFSGAISFSINKEKRKKEKSSKVKTAKRTRKKSKFKNLLCYTDIIIVFIKQVVGHIRLSEYRVQGGFFVVDPAITGIIYGFLQIPAALKIKNSRCSLFPDFVNRRNELEAVFALSVIPACLIGDLLQLVFNIMVKKLHSNSTGGVCNGYRRVG